MLRLAFLDPHSLFLFHVITFLFRLSPATSMTSAESTYSSRTPFPSRSFLPSLLQCIGYSLYRWVSGAHAWVPRHHARPPLSFWPCDLVLPASWSSVGHSLAWEGPSSNLLSQWKLWAPQSYLPKCVVSHRGFFAAIYIRNRLLVLRTYLKVFNLSIARITHSV